MQGKNDEEKKQQKTKNQQQQKKQHNTGYHQQTIGKPRIAKTDTVAHESFSSTAAEKRFVSEI